MSSIMRSASRRRQTRETDIEVQWTLDGEGSSDIDTGIPFMDHMLNLFAKHGLFNLKIKAVGDLDIDEHHTMEDLGLTLGATLAEALSDKIGIQRYGHCILPMDEALVLIALDLSGRAYLVWDVTPPAQTIKGMDTNLFNEFFRAFSTASGMNLHVRLLAGNDTHHVFEAVFKGLAKALAQAVTLNPRIRGVLSTKGSL